MQIYVIFIKVNITFPLKEKMQKGGYGGYTNPQTRIDKGLKAVTTNSERAVTKRLHMVTKGGIYMLNGTEIFELARSRTPLPDNAAVAERALYTLARYLYKTHADGEITTADAQHEKQEALRHYEKWSSAERIGNADLEPYTTAMANGTTVKHTYHGTACIYRIRGMITRYDNDRGWQYSLELIDKAGCIVYASLEDTEIMENHNDTRGNK